MVGFERAMKTGLGSAVINAGDFQVAALAVVNPLGNVLDPDTGEVLAGVRTPEGSSLADPAQVFRDMTDLIKPPDTSNTVLVAVATDARLNKIQVARVARMASAGMARTVRPTHLLYDGDTVFCLATGKGPAVDENIVGALAADVLGQAIAAGARTAVSIPGFPAHRDIKG